MTPVNCKKSKGISDLFATKTKYPSWASVKLFGLIPLVALGGVVTSIYPLKNTTFQSDTPASGSTVSQPKAGEIVKASLHLTKLALAGSLTNTCVSVSSCDTVSSLVVPWICMLPSFITTDAGKLESPSWINKEQPNVLGVGVYKGILYIAQASPIIAAGLSCHAKVVPSEIRIWSAVPIANSCLRLFTFPCHKLP